MKTKTLVTIAVLAAISIILYYLEFPLPFFPPFLKFDFSDLPAIIASLLFSPLIGLLIALIKNLVHLLGTSTGGVGELANFIVSAAFVLAAGYFYHGGICSKSNDEVTSKSTSEIVSEANANSPKAISYKFKKTKKRAIFSLLLGIVAMTVIAAIANYYILIPFYEKFMNIEAIINMCGAKSLWEAILIAFVPFNLLKGVVLSIITYLLYKRISHLIRR